MSITIFIADDHAIFRDGLRFLLETHPDFKVVGEAANGRDAVRQVAHLCPNIVIVDITMPHLNGIEATRQIYRVCPSSRVIILSMHATTKHILNTLQAGAVGYLLKESASIEVERAIRTVHAGQRYLSQKVSDRVTEKDIAQFETDEVTGLLGRLSRREREVLQLVVEGKSSSEIANLLDLSPKTIETYRTRLMRKLNLRDLPGLVKFAIQHDLTSLK